MLYRQALSSLSLPGPIQSPDLPLLNYVGWKLEPGSEAPSVCKWEAEATGKLALGKVRIECFSHPLIQSPSQALTGLKTDALALLPPLQLEVCIWGMRLTGLILFQTIPSSYVCVCGRGLREVSHRLHPFTW